LVLQIGDKQLTLTIPFRDVEINSHVFPKECNSTLKTPTRNKYYNAEAQPHIVKY